MLNIPDEKFVHTAEEAVAVLFPGSKWIVVYRKREDEGLACYRMRGNNLETACIENGEIIFWTPADGSDLNSSWEPFALVCANRTQCEENYWKGYKVGAKLLCKNGRNRSVAKKFSHVYTRGTQDYLTSPGAFLSVGNKRPSIHKGLFAHNSDDDKMPEIVALFQLLESPQTYAGSIVTCERVRWMEKEEEKEFYSSLSDHPLKKEIEFAVQHPSFNIKKGWELVLTKCAIVRGASIKYSRSKLPRILCGASARNIMDAASDPDASFVGYEVEFPDGEVCISPYWPVLVGSLNALWLTSEEEITEGKTKRAKLLSCVFE